MNKDLLAFLNGERNAFKGEVVISREKNSNGYEFVYVTVDDLELYRFWHSDKRKRKNEKPKHTGGKPSYVKLYLKRLRELRQQGVTPELIGYMIALTDNIAWDTNLIVNNKKDKKPLTAKDMEAIFMKKRSQTSLILQQLKKHKLVIKDKDGYKVAAELIQKGSVKNEAN